MRYVLLFQHQQFSFHDNSTPLAEECPARSLFQSRRSSSIAVYILAPKSLLIRLIGQINIFRRRTERRLHQVPLLTHQAYLEENGLPGVLSKEGFDLAWNQYQGYMVAKLNAMTEGNILHWFNAQ